MKNVLIIENSANSLKLINESVENKESKYEFGGIFTQLDVLNRNERIYNEDGFLPALQELKERMTQMTVFGELDHPENFETSLTKSSHMIRTIDYIKEKKEVYGTIKLLSTTPGKEARAITNDGFPLFVSSRAAGVTESNGHVSLKKLFTYDLVAEAGFASARMSSINESCGYSNNTNFRIFEMSDSSKINDIFNMNKNDMITKNQLSDYSNYLVNEISSIKKEVSSAIKHGNVEPKKLEKLLEYYDDLMGTRDDMVKYLDYLATTIQTVVSENKTLKTKQDKMEEYNNYIAEQLDKSIDYNNYIAESLDKNIGYVEYVAEKLDSNITYSEYLAESLDKTIEYSEYLSESLDKNINYSEYLAESLDKNIDYVEYIAENLDNTIEYSEYLAESLEGNIAYAEYIAENLDDNIAYADYVAESLDNTIKYSKKIVEKLNTGKVFESEGSERFPYPEEEGFDNLEEEEEESAEAEQEHESEEEATEFGDEQETSLEETPELQSSEEEETREEEMEENDEEHEESEEESDADECSTEINIKVGNVDESVLSKQIDKLITEAKKRKASETNEHHFLKFLNKSQVDSFYSLSKDEQENVVTYINEKGNYMSSSDVLKMVKEALSIESESLEQRLTRLMPETIKPIWSKLTESAKVSILSQARLHPDLNSDELVEHFWLTRNLKKNESVNKQLLSEEQLVNEDKLSDNKVNSILEKFRSL